MALNRLVAFADVGGSQLWRLSSCRLDFSNRSSTYCEKIPILEKRFGGAGEETKKGKDQGDECKEERDGGAEPQGVMKK